MIIVLSFYFQWCQLDKDFFSSSLCAEFIMLCEKVLHEIIIFHCKGICCCKMCIYTHKIVLGHCLPCMLLSRVEHILPFQMGNLSHPASCKRKLLRSEMWCPPSSSCTFLIIRKRTWGYIILCEGRIYLTAVKCVPLCLVLQADNTAHSLFCLYDFFFLA